MNLICALVGIPKTDSTRWENALIAQTADQRNALAYLLAQQPRMTPEQFARLQDMASLTNAVYPKVKSNPSLGMRETVPSRYERVIDFTQDKRLRGLEREDFESPSGFFSNLFRNKEDGKYTLAVRGTQYRQDWETNFRQGGGLRDAQYNDAMRLGKDLKEKLGEDFAGVTEDSQGGGQAAAIAMATDRPAITFNAAGLHRNTIQREGVRWSDERIANYGVEREFLGYLQDENLFTSPIMPSAAGRQFTLRGFDERGRILEPGAASRFEVHRPYNLLRLLLIDMRAQRPPR